MKSLAELQAIRDKMRQQIDLRDSGDDRIRVVVGMATCGIAAGARPVLNRLFGGGRQAGAEKRHRVPDRVHRRVPAGAHCRGVRARPGEGHLCKDDPDKVASIVSEHLVNGRVVTEYTIGAAE